MKKWFISVSVIFMLLSGTAFGAYHHMGEMDSPVFQEAYPDKVGTRIDDCALCHIGGEVETKRGPRPVGNCQWCHIVTNYGEDYTDIADTLNSYGVDYKSAGRFKVDTFGKIEGLDSDGDGYTNIEEINALTFPGDPDDNPSLVPAPYFIYNLEDIEAMPAHSQFMLMNTARGGTDGYDYYANYTGVIIKDLLEETGIKADSNTVVVYSPDGWLQNFDFESGGSNYWINDTYPEATFWYDQEADAANGGWVDYSAPMCAGRNHGDPINVDGGLWLILAYKINDSYLEPGFLNAENKLDGSGPYRVVPPQNKPGYPDRQATSPDKDDEPWPYDQDEIYTDHNAGASPRTTVAIKVGPLPEGTTDFNWTEGGWQYVDNNQIIIYGNLRNGSIEGNVADSETGDPVQGAAVKTDKGGYLVFTDAQGYFKMTGVVCGKTDMEYKLTVSKTGYQNATATVDVSDGVSSTVDFSLTEKGDDPPSPCALSFVSGDNQEILSLFRTYRDKVMAKSQAGKSYIKAYYKHAPEVIFLSVAFPVVKEKLFSSMYQAAPYVRMLLEGKDVDISKTIIPIVEDFMALISFLGSNALNSDLLSLKNDLNSPSFLDLIK